MRNYFNDSPIENTEDDLFSVAPFAEAIAKSILNIEKPIGTTIALNGPWGAGKSSAVNLIRSSLEKSGDDRLVVTEFKCWWYRGEEALALAFLQNLNAVLGATLKDKVKNLVPKLGRGLLQAGPIIGPAIALTPAGPFAAMVGGTLDFAKRYFPDEDTLMVTFQKLAEILAKEDRRFLVVIDDMDRLEPEEALAIFRLIKSVGRLPNVMYLVVFDRELAEKAVSEKYPSEGPHFLEKIIQASFELPNPLPVDLNKAVLASISEICGEPSDEHMVRFMNVFFDIVAPYITSPRHVGRFQNAISVTWPAIADEVNIADFVGLETIRLYEPTLFNSIKSNKGLVCGTQKDGSENGNDQARFSLFLKGVPNDRHEIVKTALQRLFPRLENTGYGGDFLSGWNNERRVCVEAHFDTYFRLSLSDEILSSRYISELIQRANDREYIKREFKNASTVERRNGQTMIPVYLSELTAKAKQVEKNKVGALIDVLFEIHDEIDLEKDVDKGFYAVADTTLRFHWLIRRLTSDRFTIHERTDLYLSALKTASLGWLVNFVSSARDDYQEREGRQPTVEQDCLILESAIPEVTDIVLNLIRSAAADGSLLGHKDLLNILYRWMDFMDGDESEVRQWTDSLLTDASAVAVLARVMTGTSWSFGMGGFGSLGDRIARPSVTAQIKDESKIINSEAFRNALEKIRTGDDLKDRNDQKAVRQFLDAWDAQLRGDED